MSIRAAVLWTLFVFAAGWTAGRWDAMQPDSETVMQPRVAPSETRAELPPMTGTAAPPIARPLPAPAARSSGAAPDAVASGVASTPTTRAPDPATRDALQAMMAEFRTHETIDFQAQIRSEPWAAESEAKIHAAVDQLLSEVAGARLLRADCRTTVCQAEILVPNWAVELRSKDNGAGTLHAALAGAGLRVGMISQTAGTEPDTTRMLFTMRPEDAAPKASVANGH